MAEEQPQVEAQPPKKGGIVKTLIIVVILIVVGSALAVAASWWLISEPAAVVEDNGDKLSPEAVAIPIGQMEKTLVMPADHLGPASLLIVMLTLEANNQATADLVEKYKPRFLDMIGTVHEGLTREQIDDPMIKESVRKQIELESNAMLRQMQPVASPDIRITGVFYDKWFAYDN